MQSRIVAAIQLRLDVGRDSATPRRTTSETSCGAPPFGRPPLLPQSPEEPRRDRPAAQMRVEPATPRSSARITASSTASCERGARGGTSTKPLTPTERAAVGPSGIRCSPTASSCRNEGTPLEESISGATLLSGRRGFRGLRRHVLGLTRQEDAEYPASRVPTDAPPTGAELARSAGSPRVAPPEDAGPP